MTVISEEAIPCVWNEVWEHNTAPSTGDRGGLPEGDYGFTEAQLEEILIKLEEYKNKYSSGIWTNNAIANDLVSAFDMYIEEVTDELDYQTNVNPAPTPPTDPSYYDMLVAWYESVGRGNRYAVDIARSYAGFWEQVKHLYGDDQYLEALPAPPPTPQLGAQVSEPC